MCLKSKYVCQHISYFQGRIYSNVQMTCEWQFFVCQTIEPGYTQVTCLKSTLCMFHLICVVGHQNHLQ